MLFPLIGWFHAISIEVCKIKGDCVVNHDCFFFFFEGYVDGSGSPYLW